MTTRRLHRYRCRRRIAGWGEGGATLMVYTGGGDDDRVVVVVVTPHGERGRERGRGVDVGEVGRGSGRTIATSLSIFFVTYCG